LYSAEVDIDRKSILLVMELGEVDLNYVLRQQELLSSRQQQGGHGGRGGGARSSLNMNFIRLTWQQMLTAVHSIHEERIIHSDLKPAVSSSSLEAILASLHFLPADLSNPFISLSLILFH
jgi:serine/threonine protein kinase